uniref:CSON006225 protein n=1 Tax=Culicoides sonorensis TaxID=179676 RepID=A0A336MX72_CULSO
MEEGLIFDRIMEMVGNDGKFQRRFNFLFNFSICMFVSMAFMNIMLVLNDPDHWCFVPGREKTNYSIEEWRDLVLPLRCKMYNISTSDLLQMDENTKKNLSNENPISCINGYEYDKTWYEETVVSKENWICDRTLYVTKALSLNRFGEVIGTFIFGQMGDTLGRRPVFFAGIIITILGRMACLVTSAVYWLFALSSVFGMLTALTLFQSPMVIAMEICKGEDRAHIAMLQCWGWTMGMILMPLIFWIVRDWTPFLIITTLPLLIGMMFPKYMIESPRWLANKGKYKRCAQQLQKIADVNGVKIEVTEGLIQEMLKDHQVEKVFGMASLFTSWRLAKNTSLMVISWVVLIMVYYTLVLNASKMDGNPFLNFAWQSAIELPAYYVGQILGDKMGRRFTQAFSFFLATCTCIPILFIVQHPEYAIWTSILAVIIKFNVSITFFAINLQAMEIYPTCLRQTGFSIMTVVANTMGLLGPYIVYLGTNYDVRYPYFIMGLMCLIGACSAMFLPETLGQRLPETMVEAREFGRGQKFWTESDSVIFDRIMELVGNDGKFQKRFNFIFNFVICMFVSMAFMNIVLVLNEPEHWCKVPGQELTNLTTEEWRDRVLPVELDNKKKMSFSRCKMYNLSTPELLELDIVQRRNLSDEFQISCSSGYEYDKTWYEETVVSKENWVCDRTLYVTNAFSFNRFGEVIGTFIFGQMGDTLGRRPVFFSGIVITILGRIACIFTSGTYWIFALSSMFGMLSALTLFQSPLVIAMEICKGEHRAHIAMMQCYGWTAGMMVMPLIFWYVRDWIPFLIITSFPLLIGMMFPKYMIESPRWLGNKGKYKRCARELQKIANVNDTKVKVTEALIKEMLKDHKVEKVIVLCMIYYAMVLNASKMDGNPFLNFIWQSVIELPAVFAGRYLGDKIGRRFTQVAAFVCAAITSVIVIFLVQNPDYATLTSALVVVIRFCVSVIFFAIHLQAMEIYPTCLRQTGFSVMSVVANLFGLLGPYIVYLGTTYDVRYPYLIFGILFASGGITAFFLPETLGQRLPESLAEAQEFGKGQPTWGLPKSNIVHKNDTVIFKIFESFGSINVVDDDVELKTVVVFCCLWASSFSELDPATSPSDVAVKDLK